MPREKEILSFCYLSNMVSDKKRKLGRRTRYAKRKRLQDKMQKEGAQSRGGKPYSHGKVFPSGQRLSGRSGKVEYPENRGFWTGTKNDRGKTWSEEAQGGKLTQKGGRGKKQQNWHLTSSHKRKI